jgi:hypothetical protein
MEIKVTSKDFSYATKFLKKNGYTFNSSAKTWSGTKSVSFLIEEGYATVVADSTVRLVNEDLVSNIEG